MGKLDSLKISDCPYAFASFAAKHNALVDMLAGMVGQNGISVVLAEKNAIIRGAGGAGGAGGNVTIDNVATANVVGSDGRLQNVYAGAAIANAYPTVLGVGDSAADRVRIFPDELSVVNEGTSQYVAIAFDYILMDAGSVSLEILAANITQPMGIREIDVCDGGVAKKMLVLASAPYT